jgi:predicted dehydrogenase
MRLAIVGLGLQGKKRLAAAGSDVAATVDSIGSADFRRIEDVPLDRYEAALVCTPDGPKFEILTYLLSHGKHVLVEKPLLALDDAAFRKLNALRERTGAACYTAYNHRFEPHLVAVKRLLEQQRIGRLYQASFFYGNGTARDVRNSPWRDQGLGVIPDLASHLLDLCLFFFDGSFGAPRAWSCRKHENSAFDYFLIGFPEASPELHLEGTLLSWRNAFRLDLVGESGTIQVAGLCKWGPSSLIVRTRVLPSGKPGEEVHVLEQPDPTWDAEYKFFKELCRSGGTNIENDRWISSVLNGLGESLGVSLLT